MNALVLSLLYVLLAPLVGGVLFGVDRIVTARMQSRVGPPVLQPFYDVFKLLGKQSRPVNRLQGPFVICHLVFMIFTGVLFFGGGDLLLMIFALTVSGMFLVLAAYSSSSPYSLIGAGRELVMLMACEPMLLIMLAGFYMVSGSFQLYDIASTPEMLILYLPGMFVGFTYVITMKLRKSPFDISTSHHAHQELVKGLTTDLFGPGLAMIEIAHWYETVILLGLVYLFFAFSPLIGAAAVVITYLLEILVDNTHSRAKWQWTLGSAWAVTLVLGCGNLVVLHLLRK